MACIMDGMACMPASHATVLTHTKPREREIEDPTERERKAYTVYTLIFTRWYYDCVFYMEP
jgi:hypothetical protein